jgi:hypothetical protein
MIIVPWEYGAEPSLKDMPAGQRFTAPKDGFSIALPEIVNGYAPTEGGGMRGDGKGSQTAWHLREGIIMIDHMQFPGPAFAKYETLDQYAARAKIAVDSMFRIKSDFREFRVAAGGFSGQGSSYIDQKGTRIIFRVFPIQNQEFYLSARVNTGIPDAEKLITAALDSFSIEINITQGEPQPLPSPKNLPNGSPLIKPTQN